MPRLKPKGKYVKSIYSEDYRVLISKIKKARREAGLTQSDIAKQLGWPHWSYISKIETFERKLDAVEFIKITQVIKKPIEYFINHIK